MRLVFSHSLLHDIADRWSTQYTPEKWPDRQHTTAALRALPPDATPADYAKIIGNESWSHFSCDECNTYVTKAVEVGYDHATTLCVGCCRAIAALAAADVGK